MRPLALTLAPLGLLTVLAAPALAQESPPPAPAPCDHCGNSPSPTVPPAHSDPACPRVFLESAPADVATGQVARVVLRVDSPNSDTATVRLSRVRPRPTSEVRTVTTTDDRIVFDLRLGESHDLAASADPLPGGCLSGPTPVDATSEYGSPRFRIEVRPTVGIGAVRTAPRAYTFSGRVTPGRGQAVSLSRVTADGSRVLTARGTVGGDGTYRISRRFTGSGRFGFLATVGASSTNTAGSSPVRPTVIH